MTERYEIAHSHGGESLILMFPAGAWESLPFEIRLLRPWYEGEFCDSLTAAQCSEIAEHGYSIARAADTAKTETAPERRVIDMRRRAYSSAASAAHHSSVFPVSAKNASRAVLAYSKAS